MPKAKLVSTLAVILLALGSWAGYSIVSNTSEIARIDERTIGQEKYLKRIDDNVQKLIKWRR
jgi:hypothetical protein